MKRYFYRLTSLILTGVMLLTAAPLKVWAEDEDEIAVDTENRELLSEDKLPAEGGSEDTAEDESEETVEDDGSEDPVIANDEPASDNGVSANGLEAGDIPDNDDEDTGEVVPDGYPDSVFKSFGIELDTSDPFTDKLSDGTYRKRTDSQDRILPVYELNEGKGQDADELRVTFTSARGTMNFGHAGAGAYPQFTISFKDWKDNMGGGVKIVRCGCGKDQVRVALEHTDTGIYEDYDSIEVFQEGWESFMGGSYSSRKFSGRYWKDGGFLTGWQALEYDESAGFWFPAGSGSETAYFDPVSKRPVEGIYETDGKKYFFQPVSEGDYCPYVLKKAVSDRSLVNLGSEGYPDYICLNADGTILTGIVEFGSYANYFEPDYGRLVKNTWVRNGEDVYFADAEGKLLDNGKITYEGTDYLLKDRRLMTGLVTADYGHRYYCDPVSGAITYGIITINKKKYLQTEDGIPDEAGFHNCEALDKSIYTDSKGMIVKGGKEVTLKIKIGGVLTDRIFYVNPDGTMFAGIRKVGKKTYMYTQEGREEAAEALIRDTETTEVTGYGYQDKKGNLIFYTDTGRSALVKDRIVMLSIDGFPEVIINNKGMISYGFYTLGGKKYYSDKTTGRIYDPHNASGGLMKADGKLYYFSKDRDITCPEGSIYRWMDYEGSKYYVGEDGRPVTGWKKIDDKTYYFEKSGVLNTTGLIGKKCYVMNSDKSIVKPEKAGIYKSYTGSWYLNADGSIKAGWVTVKEGGITKRCYTSPNFTRNGIITEANKIFRIGEKFYAFDNTGAMRTGWQREFAYYEDGSTHLNLGTVANSSTWFYFDKKSGAMATGKKTVTDAHPLTGKTGVFYFGTSFSGRDLPGYLVNGVLKQGSGFIPVEDGKAVSLSTHPDGVTSPGDGGQYFISKGRIVSGLISVGGAKYYFDPKTSEMVSNTLKRISGKWYYFDPDGRMSDNVEGYTVSSDGTEKEAIARIHSKGYITGFYHGDTDVCDIRIRIAGKTYILNGKGMFAKGPYTIKSGVDKGSTFLAGADYTLTTKGVNTVARYGKKYYVVDGEGKLLKSGHYSVGYGWMEAFTEAEKKQISLTSLSAWYEGHDFYTDSTGAIIKNKIITLSNGRKSYLGKYGLKVGPVYRRGSKWYCYSESGALSPGRYKVEVENMSTGKKEDAFITIGKDGRITGGVRRKDGSMVQGFVYLKSSNSMNGYYYLNKKGLPATGTKITYLGKKTFDKTTGSTRNHYS